jgi:hypothetical protein
MSTTARWTGWAIGSCIGWRSKKLFAAGRRESQCAIARATGLARETVKKYLTAAISLGLSATGPPPSEAVLIELRRLGIVAVQPVRRVAPQVAMLEPCRAQIATCSTRISCC